MDPSFDARTKLLRQVASRIVILISLFVLSYALPSLSLLLFYCNVTSAFLLRVRAGRDNLTLSNQSIKSIALCLSPDMVGTNPADPR